MSIESSFSKHQAIWDDCYLGYVICDNHNRSKGQRAIQECVSHNVEFDFYPWLNGKEEIGLPENGLNQVTPEEFASLFMVMAKEAINYGSEIRLSNVELEEILTSFLEGVTEPSYYSNFSDSDSRPVTNHSRDSFLCVVGTNKIGMWLSCDDE